MKPVNNWDSVGRGYSFKEKTWYSQDHLGLDLMTPTWTPLYAPFNGYASNGSFTEGGNVINFACNGLVMRFMHLAKISKTGYCNAGDLIGYTGNSGTLTTGAHLHVDISKGSVQIYNINNFLDPETFNWGGESMTDEHYVELYKYITNLEQANKDRIVNIDALFNRTNDIYDKLTVLTQALADNKSLAESQATEIQKAINDAQEALKASQGSTISTEQSTALDAVAKLYYWIKGLFK